MHSFYGWALHALVSVLPEGNIENASWKQIHGR